MSKSHSSQSAFESSDAELQDSATRSSLVVVCTYNERENLPLLIDAILEVLPHAELLVVDDNSPDGTGRWIEAAAAEDTRLHSIIRREERGLGGALRAGIQWALEHQFEWMLNLDADFSHDPKVLPQLLSLAQAESLDCVVGTRYASGGAIEGWPLHRRWMSRFVNRFATTILRLPVSDCSGSLRCYRVQALRNIETRSLRSQGYAIFEELLVRLHCSGATMGELPITFQERRIGVSKLTPIEAVKAMMQLIRLSISR